VAQHLLRDLEHLKKDILTMGAMVEEAIELATTSLMTRRPEIARRVIENDDVIDQKELEVEEECLKDLALHQPVAKDLRFIVAIMKVNNDLERMGDLAVNIAQRALFLAEHTPIAIPIELREMVRHVGDMVKNCLDALVNQDVEIARGVIRADDTVDILNREMFRVLEAVIREDPETVERALNVLSVSRNLERMADAATNIAEDVVFMVEGEVIRHKHAPGRGTIPGSLGTR